MFAAAVIESWAALICLKLFTEFPFNNLLHHIVTATIAAMLEQGSDAVLEHLLQEGRLVPWLVEAPEDVIPQMPESRPNQGTFPSITLLSLSMRIPQLVQDAFRKE